VPDGQSSVQTRAIVQFLTCPFLCPKCLSNPCCHEPNFRPSRIKTFKLSICHETTSPTCVEDRYTGRQQILKMLTTCVSSTNFQSQKMSSFTPIYSLPITSNRTCRCQVEDMVNSYFESHWEQGPSPVTAVADAADHCVRVSLKLQTHQYETL
jgi:hypothetical protein